MMQCSFEQYDWIDKTIDDTGQPTFDNLYFTLI